MAVAKKLITMHNFEDLKIWLINLSVIYFTLTNVEVTLKIISLLLAIAYTFRRWYLMETKNKKDENKY